MADNWQQIETLPDDNEKPVWIAHAPTGVAVIGYQARHMPRGVWYLMWRDKMLSWTPTHWMPLPTPPTELE